MHNQYPILGSIQRYLTGEASESMTQMSGLVFWKTIPTKVTEQACWNHWVMLLFGVWYKGQIQF